MKIILSPAKKMKTEADSLEPQGLPVYIDQAHDVLTYLKGQTYDQLKKLWACNDKIAQENFQRLEYMDLEKAQSPAILSYDGIAYQYMAPSVFQYGEFDYVQEHLRILSAFYGVVKPMDAVTPYRLEMQAKASINGLKDLYDFWGDILYKEVRDASGIIINLASKEYSRCIEKYLQPEDTYITCVFGEISGSKVVQKGVYAKMARGEMVRYMAENNIEDTEEIKHFDRLGYAFEQELSDEKNFVFLRK